MAEHYLGNDEWRFDTVRELLDELDHYQMGGEEVPGIMCSIVRYKFLNVEPLANPRTLRVGFKVEVVDRVDDETKGISLWIRVHGARTCGAWGRALSTVEGRRYVAQRGVGNLYWTQESPRDEQYGVVLFDP